MLVSAGRLQPQELEVAKPVPSIAKSHCIAFCADMVCSSTYGIQIVVCHAAVAGACVAAAGRYLPVGSL